jgi:parallel beta-helix repeat protein
MSGKWTAIGAIVAVLAIVGVIFLIGYGTRVHVLLGMATQPVDIQIAEIFESVYINADGSIDPPTAPMMHAGNTYTLNSSIYYSGEYSAIIIKRENIEVDGAGHTVQGTGAVTSKGISLSEVNNVTVKNLTIQAFGSGIWLNASLHTNISGVYIAGSARGIIIDGSSNCSSISENEITGNSLSGIEIYGSSNSSISRNNITRNAYGISCYSTSNQNHILGNYIGNNTFGLYLYSSNNSIIGNSIVNNNRGLKLLDFSADTNISGNQIARNNYGIELERSSNSRIHHNNFMKNTQQVYISAPSYDNSWHAPFPSGGNYWDNHVSVDFHGGPLQDELGSDGIADTDYVIDSFNRDNYPLMGPFSTFDSGTWNGTVYDVDVVSNSTVSDYQVDTFQKAISFNVTGVEETAGFCRATIPNIIIQYLWQGNFTVLLDNEPWPFTNWTDPTYTYIYINYADSENQVTIVPEFPSLLILPPFMIATLLAVKAHRKRRIRTRAIARL